MFGFMVSISIFYFLLQHSHLKQQARLHSFIIDTKSLEQNLQLLTCNVGSKKRRTVITTPLSYSIDILAMVS